MWEIRRNREDIQEMIKDVEERKAIQLARWDIRIHIEGSVDNELLSQFMI